MTLLKSKSVGIVWEFMFTRPMYPTIDRPRQHELLDQIANLFDSGQIKSTINTAVRKINLETIRQAHLTLQDGRSIGKMVLSGFNA